MTLDSANLLVWVFRAELLDKMQLRARGMALSTEIKIEAAWRVKKPAVPSYLSTTVTGAVNLSFAYGAMGWAILSTSCANASLSKIGAVAHHG